MHLVDIIIPTYDNYEYLAPCLQSILRNKMSENLFHIYVVNNGHLESCNWIYNRDVTVFNAGKNLGWEGGLKFALEKTEAPYVMFLNDDTYIPSASKPWINNLLQPFLNETVGAVGPSSNVVMGMQNIFSDTQIPVFPTKFLIGFCFLVKREALEKAGGIDDTLPGGDDLDLSIRLRKAGYKLVCNKDVFVYHHGFKTGTKIYGNEQKLNGWNSFAMYERTNTALIKKHGFKEWWYTMRGAWEQPDIKTIDAIDIEGKLIAERVQGEKILDLGCGHNKTIPNAIGVDMVPKDAVIDTLAKQVSVADVTADVSQPLPFEPNSVDTIIARHILEHLTDSVTILGNWRALLKEKGRIIIAVPDDCLIKSIPLNIEHVHNFSKESVKSLLEVVGFKVVEQLDSGNHISFITIGEKA